MKSNSKKLNFAIIIWKNLTIWSVYQKLFRILGEPIVFTHTEDVRSYRGGIEYAQRVVYQDKYLSPFSIKSWLFEDLFFAKD